MSGITMNAEVSSVRPSRLVAEALKRSVYVDTAVLADVHTSPLLFALISLFRPFTYVLRMFCSLSVTPVPLSKRPFVETDVGSPKAGSS